MAADSNLFSPLALRELIETLGDPEAPFDSVGALSVVATAVDAELAAVCRGDTVVVATGLDTGPRPDEILLTLARTRPARAGLPGCGSLHLAFVDMAETDETVVVARADRPFGDDEIELVGSLCRVVGLAITMRAALEAERSARVDLESQFDHNRRLVEQLRERQGLLDRLFRIQQSISHRSPTQDVLDSVTAGALDLLGATGVTLRLIDLEDPRLLVLVSSQGFASVDAESMRETNRTDGSPGQAVGDNRLVVEPTCSEDGRPGAMMSTPVSVGGEVVGCLTVSTTETSRRFTPPEQEALISLAQHASLALQDARATDAMRKALDRERHRAEHDPLTGLPNRPTIRAALAHRIGIADKVPVVLLFVDLDRFKLANDTLGHRFGDIVLTVVADRLRTSVRGADVVGRLSGDEFVVICEGMTEVGAVEFAERLQAVISEPIVDRHVEHVITASIGIARAHRGESAEQLLANADLAMYRAKEKGRGGVEVFDVDLRTSVEERLALGQDLRRALAQGELRVHLQPVVELPTRRVTGFEALVRWAHPTRGLLFPEAFVDAAEETGLIGQLDRFVLSRTVGLLAAHESARPIAVNLSTRSFADPTLVDWIAGQLADHSVAPGRLHVEITETVLMDRQGTAKSQIEALRELGLMVMIDDFGTGYSSLAYLQSFEVDGVKIDQGFIQQIGTETRAEAIIAAVFSMAAALDLMVVAEGVETDEQMNRIVALRDRAGLVQLRGQGYLFGRAAEGDARLSGFIEVPSAVGG